MTTGGRCYSRAYALQKEKTWCERVKAWAGVQSGSEHGNRTHNSKAGIPYSMRTRHGSSDLEPPARSTHQGTPELSRWVKNLGRCKISVYPCKEGPPRYISSALRLCHRLSLACPFCFVPSQPQPRTSPPTGGNTQMHQSMMASRLARQK